MTNENAGRTKGSYRMSVSLAGGQSVDSPFCHFVMGRKNELKALGMTERCTNTNSRTQDEDRCRRMIDIERNTKRKIIRHGIFPLSGYSSSDVNCLLAHL